LPKWNTRQAGEKMPEDPSFKVKDQLLSLINQAEKDLDSNTLRALLEMYTTTLDWQIQQKIESILAGADEEMWVMILLQEMPRLAIEVPAWAVSLLGEEVENRFQPVRKCLTSMPEEVQKAVHNCN
jgi:hypothetical protein